jgi:hypothetical protein
MTTLAKNLFVVLGMWLLVVMGIPIAQADHAAGHVDFNWQQRGTLSGTADFSCGRGVADPGCNIGGSADPDKTAFLQEIVTIQGIQYFHMIVGGVDSSGNPANPTSANQATVPFGQEVFIRTQGGTFCFATVCSYSGGNESGFSNNGNGYDPLANNMTSSGTGNRSGFPTRVMMKEVMNDGQISQVFLKDVMANKPKITQTITSKDTGGTIDMTAEFVIDMSNSTYSDNTKAGLITNKLTFAGANAKIPGNFDTNGSDNSFVTANAQAGKTNVTGGRYTFVEGSAGNSGSFGQGTYTYITGDDAVSNLDWNAFRNRAENPLTYGTSTTARSRSGDICKSGSIGSVPAGC